MKVKCKKDLYKSTYGKNAFTKGAKYTLLSYDDNFYLIEDNNKNTLDFYRREDSNVFYKFNEYFDIV